MLCSVIVASEVFLKLLHVPIVLLASQLVDGLVKSNSKLMNAPLLFGWLSANIQLYTALADPQELGTMCVHKLPRCLRVKKHSCCVKIASLMDDVKPKSVHYRGLSKTITRIRFRSKGICACSYIALFVTQHFQACFECEIVAIWCAKSASNAVYNFHHCNVGRVI